MKQTITLFAAILLLAVGAAAQKLSYQAVVRNNANELVAETTVQVAVSVLDASNAVQYAETHANVQTNRNGLLSLMVGDGTPTGNTTLADVVWPGASLRTVIILPDNTTIITVTPINTVPYALYAENVDPAMVSAAVATYIASHNIGGEDNVQADWNETDPSSDAFIRNKPDLFSGDYNDLTNKPTIPTNVSAFTNDAGYITEAQCDGVDICALLDMVAALQQQVADLQAQLDSAGQIVDTTIVHTDFHCGTSTVTDHEGNVYNTVQIGDQCWTKENLRTTTSPTTGTYLIPASGTGYSYTGKQARWYNNDSATYAAQNYGLLYNWNAAIDTFNTAYGETSVNTSSDNVVSVTFNGHRRGICPVGWHLPSDAEWNTMEAAVSGSDWQTSNETTNRYRGSHAGKLAGGDNWTSSTTSGAPGEYGNADRNASGFGAVPAGYCNGSSFFDAGNYASYWSSTQTSSGYAYTRSLDYSNAGVYRGSYIKRNGRSVRCLRDSISSGSDTPTPQDTTVTPTDTTGPSHGFHCGTSTVTDHEGNVYNTVQIGDQCWTKENLRTTTSPTTGTYLIPAAGTNCTYTGKQAHWYNNDSATYAPMNYGLLYNWNAAADTFNTAYGELSVNTSSSNAVSVTFNGYRRGICPVGWHLPSDAEWTTMTNYVSSQSEYLCNSNTDYIAKALANSVANSVLWSSSTETCAVGNNLYANNATGFSAVPAGGFFYSYYGSRFFGAGNYAHFWSFSQPEGLPYDAFNSGLYSDAAYVEGVYNTKENCHSVRCLRDSISSGSDTPTPTDTTGTSYGIPCPGTPTVTDHEGNAYNTVQIGYQCWMKENLRTTIKPDGSDIALNGGRYCPNNNANNVAVYGYLYTWEAVMNGAASSSANSSYVQGICPTGWHVPSDEEWEIMTYYVKSHSEYLCGSNTWYIAKALAGRIGWNSSTTRTCAVGNNLNANNATGFSAVPAGSYNGSSFSSVGNDASFWSSSQDESDPYNAYGRYLHKESEGLSSFSMPKNYGYSVRCLRD